MSNTASASTPVWEPVRSAISFFTGISQLTGSEDYLPWSIIVMNALTSCDVLEVVTGEETCPAKDVDSVGFANWKKKDNQAKTYLLRCISSPLVVQVGNCSTSHAMWLVLKQYGDQKGSGTLMYWMRRLVTPLPESGSSEFPVPSYLQAALLLATLPADPKDPKSWYSFIRTQSITKDTELSDIISAIKETTRVDAAIMPQSDAAVEAALSTLERGARHKGEYWCTNCWTKGHTKSYCTNPGGGQHGKDKKKKKKKEKGSKGKEKAHAAEDGGGGETSNVVLEG
ncbi:hypothetical protein MPER_12732, partial [Moniliophthora perniciosa FA553]